MTVKLNHTIVAAHDKHVSAAFLADILGLPAPTAYGPFLTVPADNGVTLDYADWGDEVATQHYAFLVDEDDFDVIFGRIRDRQLPYWADPHQSRKGEINTADGGRGVYFEDPSGHLLEILTRPYGSRS
jgi:catechol 2,3-dioxygenase-like lactoylglutathione lyase family enzyme